MPLSASTLVKTTGFEIQDHRAFNINGIAGAQTFEHTEMLGGLADGYTLATD